MASLLARETLLVLTLLCLLPLMAGCPTKVEVVADGTSSVTFTVPPGGLKLKLKGPITLPEGFPGGLGGLVLGPGAELDVDLPPGTTTLQDVIKVGCNGSENSPTGSGSCNLHSSSAYTFRLPDLLGPGNTASVPVTGSASGSADIAAFMPLGGGQFEFDNSGLLGLTLEVSGPGPSWAAPLDTPFGTVTGTGSMELASFVLRFTGDLSSVDFGFDTHARSYAAAFAAEIDFEGDILTGGSYTEQGTYVEGAAVPAASEWAVLALVAALLVTIGVFIRRGPGAENG